jgi:hypothetical protein
MRDVRNREILTGAPYRPEPSQQLIEESYDIMRRVPYEMALRAREEQQEAKGNVQMLRSSGEALRALPDSRDQIQEARRSDGEENKNEIRMGLDWWAVEPDVGRTCGQMKGRAAQIKALGNAQVPIQAALAWMMLGGPT